jgi:hypothetical protein
MAEAPRDLEPIYDATVGESAAIDVRLASDPDAGRIRVRLGGALAQAPIAAALAAELETLIATALNPPAPGLGNAPQDDLEISLEGLGLAPELEADLTTKIRAHIEARLGVARPGGASAARPAPDGAQ